MARRVAYDHTPDAGVVREWLLTRTRGETTLHGLERFPCRQNREGIPESAKNGFTFEAGQEAGLDGETLF